LLSGCSVHSLNGTFPHLEVLEFPYRFRDESTLVLDDKRFPSLRRLLTGEDIKNYSIDSTLIDIIKVQMYWDYPLKEIYRNVLPCHWTTFDYKTIMGPVNVSELSAARNLHFTSSSQKDLDVFYQKLIGFIPTKETPWGSDVIERLFFDQSTIFMRFPIYFGRVSSLQHLFLKKTQVILNGVCFPQLITFQCEFGRLQLTGTFAELILLSVHSSMMARSLDFSAPRLQKLLLKPDNDYSHFQIGQSIFPELRYVIIVFNEISSCGNGLTPENERRCYPTFLPVRHVSSLCVVQMVAQGPVSRALLKTWRDLLPSWRIFRSMNTGFFKFDPYWSVVNDDDGPFLWLNS